MSTILTEYILHLRSIARAEDSFYEFCKQAFPQFDPQEYVDGWHIKALCDHCEACYRGDISFLVANIPPRCMKTAIMSVMFPAWVWIHNPGAQFLCIMASEPILFKASDDFETLISSKWYQTRWGNKVKLSRSQNSKGHRKNTENGSRMASTILGKIVGRGGQFIIVDDPNNSKESDTQRATINEIWNYSIVNRANNPKKAVFMVCMQRVAENDLTGHVTKGEGLKDIVWFRLPMEYELETRCETIPLPGTDGKNWSDPRIKKGDLLWPELFDRESLDKLYRRIGNKYVIAGQYQQRPSPGEGGVLKRVWFNGWTQRALPEITHIIQSWDTAFSREEADKKSTSIAYSVCTTWGLFKDRENLTCLILLSVWRDKVEFPELIEIASKLAKDYRDDGTRKVKKSINDRYKPDRILIEAQATGTPLIQELARVGVIATKFDPRKLGSKIDRVRMISHLIEDGRVYLLAKPDGSFEAPAECLIEECAKFPNGTYKDQVDTLTQVLYHLRETGWLEHSEDSEPDRRAEDNRVRLYD